MNSRWLLALALAGLMASPVASAQEQDPSPDTTDNAWPKTRISFTFGHENVLVKPGETKESVPGALFGACDKSILARTTSQECGGVAANLVLYKRLTFSKTFQPEAALSLRIRASDSGADMDDNGSYLRLNYFLSPSHDKFWALTLFPVDADRMRLGYHYDVSWGGTDSFPKNFRRGAAPGLKFDLDYKYWHFFVGAKGALVRSPADDILDNPGGNTLKNVVRVFYGGLAGFGVEFMDTGLRLEMNGGIFNKGTNTRQNAIGQDILAGGVSGRLSYRFGMPIGRQIDIRLYQQDPIRSELFEKENYKGGKFSMAAEIEGTFLIQSLEDPDRVNSTRNEQSWMSHVGFAMKYGHFRMHLHAIYRDLTAILFDVPGFVPYQALPENTETSGEIYASLAADYNIQPIDLTIGLKFGLLKPATYNGIVPAGTTASSTDQGRRKVVVRGSGTGDWDILPAGEDELLVFSTELSVKWSFYDFFAVVGEISYERDDNVAQVIQDAQGHNVRVFDEPNRLGFMILSEMLF
ncbi:MAG: hypothetical protein ACI9OJ_000598 [Myxococcota bacterium]|jgi:hypothetical protein